jgi:hypothetical protein
VTASPLRAGPALAPVLLAVLLAVASLAPARAQVVRVTAGEHADFTRVVLQSAGSFAWSLAEDGADLRVVLPGRTLSADPETVFSRIPRTRLAALRIEGEALVLTRPCACPAEGFEDRPGVLVIDLRDGPPLTATPPLPRPPGAAPATPGLNAGRALARRLAATVPDTDASGVAAVLPDPADLVGAIPAEIAAAMTRGLLPAPARARAPQVLGPSVELEGLSALPPNLALRGADEPVPAPEPDPDAQARQAACPDPSAFDALSMPPEQDFAAGLAMGRAGLYGEFDQPDPDRWQALATHYLQWGLGAEARQILDTDGLGIADRDLLGAMADLLEGHASNRRARLAGHLDCPGPVALLALLAAPPEHRPGPETGGIVASFQTLTPALREVLGPPLVRRLIAAGQIEGARIVREAVGRSSPETEALLDALLEQGRGELARAAARLDGTGTDPEALRLGLELALTRGEALPEARLRDAADLAETLRSTDQGRAIGELVLRHHALAGQLDAGFALLDRFVQWAPPGPDHLARVDALRSVLWFAAAGRPDAEFLVLALGRGDWRDPALAPAAQAALAARFEALGLGQLAANLGDGRASAAPPAPTPAMDLPEGQPAPLREGEAPVATDPGATALPLPPGPVAAAPVTAAAGVGPVQTAGALAGSDREPVAGGAAAPPPDPSQAAPPAPDTPAQAAPAPRAALPTPEAALATGTDAMAQSQRRLAESEALRQALAEQGLR